jgi:hypothetical protein
LDQYLAVFPRERILVISSDDLRHRRTQTLGSIFSFLGVDPEVELAVTAEEFHRGDDKRRIYPAMEGVRTLLRRTGFMTKVPKELKWKARTTLSTPVPEGRTRLDEETSEYIWSALASDLARLREILGPDFYLWGKA